MRSDFKPSKIKSAKQNLAKNLEIARGRRKTIVPEEPPKPSYWDRFKQKISGFFK
jgi:hypothetical protein